MNPKVGLRQLEDLQSSINSKKAEIESIDERIAEVEAEKNKILCQKENPPLGEDKISFISRANAYLINLDKKISDLHDVRVILVREEHRLKLSLNAIDKPALEGEIKEAGTLFNKLINDYLSHLPQLFDLTKQIKNLADKYGTRVPQEITNKQVFKYQSSLKGADISTWGEFVKSNIDALRVGGWIYYKIKE